MDAKMTDDETRDNGGETEIVIEERRKCWGSTKSRNEDGAKLTQVTWYVYNKRRKWMDMRQQNETTKAVDNTFSNRKRSWVILARHRL
jgi:hypothetical protein